MSILGNFVADVKARITFTFKDNSQFTLESSAYNDNTHTGLNNYCTSLTLKEQLFKNSSNNVVGDIVGNTLSLSIVSNDRKLIPQNVSSDYAGMMDDTAYIDVTFLSSYEYEDDQQNKITVTDEEEYMGRYYVETWEGGTDASKSNEVSICAVDLFSKIKNIPLDDIKLVRNCHFIDYIINIRNKINGLMPASMQISSNNDYIDIFRNSPYRWEMVFNNIDRDTVEVMFNAIASDTISWIWIDRNRNIVTDHLLDDISVDVVYELSGSTNLLSYNTTAGAVNKYQGVEVQYISSVSVVDDKIVSMNGTTLDMHDNTIEKVKMNKSTVLNIDTCVTNNQAVSVKPLSWYKDSINLSVYNDAYYGNFDIDIYGSYLDEKYNTITKLLTSPDDNNYNQGNIIKVTNRVLNADIIDKYSDGLLMMLQCKNNQISCEGYINPKLKCGNDVHFVGSKLNVDGVYKVSGLEFSLNGSSYKVKCDIIKVESVVEDLDSLFNQQVNLLYNAVYSNNNVDPELVNDLTEVGNDRVVAAYGSNLESLEQSI